MQNLVTPMQPHIRSNRRIVNRFLARYQVTVPNLVAVATTVGARLILNDFVDHPIDYNTWVNVSGSSWLVLCDTWNRSDDNDTVSGIAILDTTAIPEMRYAISMFFRNRQSHTLVGLITEMCVSSSVSTVCTMTRL